MSFLDKFLSLFSPGAGASAKPSPPASSPPRPQKRTKKQKQAEQRAARRQYASTLTNRRTISFRSEGRAAKQKVAKKNGEWHFYYDKDWFPVRGLPSGELKSALAAKGVS